MRTIVLFVATLFLAISISGQIAAAGGYIESAFDTAVEKLPPRFRGNDPMKFWTELSIYGWEFGQGCKEFETTNDCKRRIDGLSSRPMGRGMSVSDTLAISLPSTCKFNADLGVFRCASNLNIWFDPGYLLATKNLGSGSYVGENVFGVRKRITAKSVESWYLRLIGTPRVFDTDPLDTAKARLISSSLRVLAVGSFTSPFVVSDVRRVAPTVESPFELTDRSHRAYFEISEVWIYDITTGEIIKKFAS